MSHAHRLRFAPPDAGSEETMLRMQHSRCMLLLLGLAALSLAACSGGSGASAGTMPAAGQSAVTSVSGPAPSPPPLPGPSPTPIQTTLLSSSGNVATYAGCNIFAPGDYYNAPVTNAPVDPNSAAYISGNYSAGNTGGIQMYFPSHEYVNLATNSTPLAHLTPTGWGSAWSGITQVPWAPSFQIENPPSDQHAMVLNTSTCTLYEYYSASYNASTNTLSEYGGWHWNLSQPFQVLPKDEPSAMASGLSLFAGMVKWEEVQAGSVNHALNIALPAGTLCYRCFVTPASSTESYTFKGTSPYQLPYGAHLRLKPSVNISGFSPQAQIILRAMQTYGVYIADTGCCMDMYDATPLDGNNAHWDAAGIDAALGSLRITDFDVLTLPQIQYY